MAHVPAAGPMIQRCSDTTAPSAFSPAPTAPLCEESRRCLSVHHALHTAGLFESTPAWRVSPVPFQLTAQDVSFFETLGPQLWSFSKALNRLYLDSVKGRQPFWVHQYLDQGKPPALLEYARMKRFREAVPQVIRPRRDSDRDGHDDHGVGLRARRHRDDGRVVLRLRRVG